MAMKGAMLDILSLRSFEEFGMENGVNMVVDEVESLDALRSEVKLASGRVLHFFRCVRTCHS